MSSFACELCGNTISDNDEAYKVFGHLVCERCKINTRETLLRYNSVAIVKEVIDEEVKKKKGS